MMCVTVRSGFGHHVGAWAPCRCTVHIECQTLNYPSRAIIVDSAITVTVQLSESALMITVRLRHSQLNRAFVRRRETEKSEAPGRRAESQFTLPYQRAAQLRDGAGR